jgi:hypothetical protein
MCRHHAVLPLQQTTCRSNAETRWRRWQNVLSSSPVPRTDLSLASDAVLLLLLLLLLPLLLKLRMIATLLITAIGLRDRRCSSPVR